MEIEGTIKLMEERVGEKRGTSPHIIFQTFLISPRRKICEYIPKMGKSG